MGNAEYMGDEQQHTRKDPEIFKHLSPKTQGYLRASANTREERARLNENTMSTEQTFIAIKPDGVQRGLIGPIISRFEARGYIHSSQIWLDLYSYIEDTSLPLSS